MACELATELTNPRMLKFFRKEGIVEQKIRRACQQMSLAMKEPIQAQLSTKAKAVELKYTIVEAGFPNLSDRSINKILIAVYRAYLTLTTRCVMCPTRCISEKDEDCVLFFDPDVNQSEFGVAKEASRV